MRTSITILRYEHGVIRQMLDVLSEVIRIGKVEENCQDVRELLRFLNEYVDRFHHYKEEELFLPVVRQKFPDYKQDVLHILDEHRQIRKLFEEVITALDEKDWKRLDRSGMGLVRQKTAHLEKEETHVFGEIEDNLSLDLDESLSQSFAQHLSTFTEDYNEQAELFANEIQDRLLGSRLFNRGIY